MHLTSKQRKNFTSIGHRLSPVVYIGKNGLTGEAAAVVRVIGNTALLFRQNPDPEKRTVDLF